MSTRALANALGGHRTLGVRARSLAEFSEAIEAGIPRSAAEHLRQRQGWTEAELAHSLGVSARTLQRQAREPDGRLTPLQGDRLFRLARIVAFAEEVLENADRARRWLKEPQRGLGGRVPLALLRTEAGAREVEDLLGRIEHGVYS